MKTTESMQLMLSGEKNCLQGYSNLNQNRSLDTYVNILKNFNQYADTDLKSEQIISYVTLMLGVKEEDIGSKRIPVDGGYKNETIRGMEVLAPDITKNKVVFEEYEDSIK